jgi:GPI-anchor transamidase subunit T
VDDHHWTFCRGTGIGATAPPGATLQVGWHPAVTSAQEPELWNGVTNAISGLFCSSLNTLAPRTMHYAAAIPSAWPPFAPPKSAAEVSVMLSNSSAPQGHALYGALTQEAVCTENLTGFLKLLPCRDQAGFGALLDPGVVFASGYHTLELHAWIRPDSVFILSNHCV